MRVFFFFFSGGVHSCMRSRLCASDVSEPESSCLAELGAI